MSTTVPGAPACPRFTWCENPDPDHDRHRAFVADIHPHGATIEIFYTQSGQDGATPYLQLFYGLDWARQDSLAIPLPAAGALAELLALLNLHTWAEFTAALELGSKGPRKPRSTQW